MQRLFELKVKKVEMTIDMIIEEHKGAVFISYTNDTGGLGRNVSVTMEESKSYSIGDPGTFYYIEDLDKWLTEEEFSKTNKECRCKK